jgi:hypothetical protein
VGTIIGGIVLAVLSLFLIVGIMMLIRWVIRAIIRKESQVRVGIWGVPVWAWLVSSLFNVSYFGQLQSEPGADGMMAVGGDVSVLLFVALAIVFIVRGIRLRGVESRS